MEAGFGGGPLLLEFFIARASNIFVEVKDVDRARTASTILEKGVTGLIIKGNDPIKIKEIIQEFRSGHGRLELNSLKADDPYCWKG